MVALVRTPDRHEPVTSRTPSLKPSHNTCLQVAGLQEYAMAPGEYIGWQKDTRTGTLALSLLLSGESFLMLRESSLAVQTFGSLNIE